MSFFGFKNYLDGTCSETLPNLELGVSTEQKRRVALELINSHLCVSARIATKSIDPKKSLFEIVKEHMLSLLERSKPSYAKTDLFIDKLEMFLAHTQIDALNLETKDLKYVYEFLDLFHINAFYLQLHLDLDVSFTRLVYRRMIPANTHKTIVCYKDKIVVRASNQKDLVIYPKWENIDTLALSRVDHEIEKAHQTMNATCDKVYLVFPKNESFKRHISVIGESIKSNETIKLVPYHFKFCTICV